MASLVLACFHVFKVAKDLIFTASILIWSRGSPLLRSFPVPFKHCHHLARGYCWAMRHLKRQSSCQHFQYTCMCATEGLRVHNRILMCLAHQQYRSPVTKRFLSASMAPSACHLSRLRSAMLRTAVSMAFSASRSCTGRSAEAVSLTVKRSSSLPSSAACLLAPCKPHYAA